MSNTIPNLRQSAASPHQEAAQKRAQTLRSTFLAAGALGVFVACMIWAYWPTFENMWTRWSTDPQYSHGFLVPVFALVVLWSRRAQCPKALAAPSLWGLALVAGALSLRLLSGYFYLMPLDGLSLLLLLAGLTLIVGGTPALRWTWPALAFLGFMLPLPFQIETALSEPLRQLATVSSTYLLQTLGYPALAEGNIIIIDDVELGVIDACNGLGMLFTFFALTTAVALIIDRPLLDRILVVASAIPIALVVNVIRITITSVAHLTLGAEIGRALMHDFAGWLMMPMALGLLWLEYRFLSCLLLPAPVDVPLPLQLTGQVFALNDAALHVQQPVALLREPIGALTRRKSQR